MVFAKIGYNFWGKFKWPQWDFGGKDARAPWKKWFIFHWDFTKIDPLNKVNC